MEGSTVFYTAILLGVFVVYVFDGPSTMDQMDALLDSAIVRLATTLHGPETGNAQRPRT